MTPAQLNAYSAICEADPACRCPLLDGHDAGLHNYHWWRAVLSDHLHTRLCSLDEDRRVSIRSDGSWRERQIPDKRFTTKLSAYLAAHVVLLGLDRTLIEKMEEA